MKYVLIGRNVAIAAIVSSVTAIASASVVLAERIPLESNVLGTQPASVDQLGQRGQPIYTRTKLNEVAGSISGKPLQRREPSIVPEGLLPADMLTPPAPKPVDPIDFFKVPSMDRSVKMPINRY